MQDWSLTPAELKFRAQEQPAPESARDRLNAKLKGLGTSLVAATSRSTTSSVGMPVAGSARSSVLSSPRKSVLFASTDTAYSERNTGAARKRTTAPVGLGNSQSCEEVGGTEMTPTTMRHFQSAPTL